MRHPESSVRRGGDRAIDGVHLLLLVGALANPVRLPADDRALRGRHQDLPLITVAVLANTHGASDLAFDTEGRAWVVTERSHTLVPVLGGSALRIEGVPEGLDLEALSFPGPGRLLFGTERHTARTSHPVLEGRITADRAVVVGSHEIDYAALGLVVARNQGIEGLCTVNEHTVLALETPREDGGIRRGVLLVDGQVVELLLGSATGKLSALSCADDGADGLELWAIERHYGVARLLHARLPLDPLPARVVPQLWTNLSARLDAPLPNFEGVAQRDGALWLVNDDEPSPPGTVTRVLALTSTRGGS